MHLRRRIIAAAVFVAAVFFGGSADAVILRSTATRNTIAPAGALANSGWQLQGRWRGFLGTPISKKYFITAGHGGGDVGTKFYLGARVFTTTAMWDDPATDLRIYSVNKTFDAWAPRYTGNREVGKHAIIFGRGTQRGNEVRANTILKGWEWGTNDQVQSRGLNQIDQAIVGEADEGSLLQSDFDFNGITNEGTISAGDSGGGAFIYNKITARWELAGINYSVDGPFKRTSNGADFNAALYDLGGIFYGGQTIPDATVDNPSRFFLSRLSTNQSWINAVFSGALSPTALAPPSTQGVPEPTIGALMLTGGLAFLRLRK